MRVRRAQSKGAVRASLVGAVALRTTIAGYRRAGTRLSEATTIQSIGILQHLKNGVGGIGAQGVFTAVERHRLLNEPGPRFVSAATPDRILLKTPRRPFSMERILALMLAAQIVDLRGPNAVRDEFLPPRLGRDGPLMTGREVMGPEHHPRDVLHPVRDVRAD